MQITRYVVLIVFCSVLGSSSSFIAAKAAPRLLTLTELASYNARRSLLFFLRSASSSQPRTGALILTFRIILKPLGVP